MRALVLGVAVMGLVGCYNPVLDQIRQRAAHDFTCNKSKIDVKRVQGVDGTIAGTYVARGCGKKRDYHAVCGNAGCLVDAESEVSGPPDEAVAGSAEPTASGPEPPDGVAGFDFDATLEQAQAKCEGAGHSFATKGTTASCSGTAADVGFESEVELLICSDAVCGVRVHRALEPSLDELADVLANLLQTLSARYGKPAKRNIDMNVHCTDVDRCIEEGNLTYAVGWRWPQGHQINLGVLKKTRRIRLEYRAPKGVTGELDL